MCGEPAVHMGTKERESRAFRFSFGHFLKLGVVQKGKLE